MSTSPVLVDTCSCFLNMVAANVAAGGDICSMCTSPVLVDSCFLNMVAATKLCFMPPASSI